ncbi:MFS-type efflux pump [Drechslerella dactyloides]|uniref:MFS-type efflux pump n=1 Tax=Drechslerella dactyloides TaxID=74499 RepID=A0AAD6IQY8_DREDA|nr:MFS-type efflux pump [Drechslerella dactyloides]
MASTPSALSETNTMTDHVGLSDHAHEKGSLEDLAAPARAAPQDAEKNDDVAPADDVEPEHVYPKGTALASIIIALILAIFLVALDRTIISTAIPVITNEFNSLGDVGWYGSAYLITAAGFMPVSGKIYSFYPTKWVFLIQIVFFEVGSALCGWAPNSTAFIIGRAIAGAGSSGLFTGAIVLLTDAVPLHKRSTFMGAFGGVFGVSGVVGPIMGGAFAQHSTWRWSFWINLPIGAVTVVIISFLIKAHPARKNMTVREQLKHLDPIGTALFLPSMICLILALQWGGTEYPWSSGRVIALFVVFGVSIIAFIGVQIWKQEEASFPPRVFVQRSIAAGMWYQTFTGGAMMLFIYYLPIWFQAIQGVNATDSGIRLIPIVLSLVFASMIAGAAVRFLGYYTPFMIASSVIMSIGSGLLTTLTPTATSAKWIGYQVLFGFGLGLGMQQPSIAAQAVLKRVDIPIGTSMIMFCQTLGGAVFIAVGQTSFANKLVSNLRGITGNGFDANQVIHIGATDVNRVVQPEFLPQVHKAYNDAIIGVFYVAVGISCATIFGALAMEWVSTRKEVDEQKKAATPPPEEV